MTRAVEAMKGAIEDYVGHRPETCPWRAAYDPIVREGTRLFFDAADGLSQIDEDTPAVWLDAARVFSGARRAVVSRDAADEHKRRMKRASRR